MIIIDYHWLSLIILNYHWLSLIIIGHPWLSLIIIDYHWLSLIIFGYHWCSLIIMNYQWFQWWSLIIIDYHWLSQYVYIWSRVPCSYPPQWYGSPGSTPFPSICKLLAAFLRSSLVFARSLQHFWLPASHLLGTCYLLDDLRSTHTPSKYLRATYSHIYMCYVSTSYLLPVYSHNTTCV